MSKTDDETERKRLLRDLQKEPDEFLADHRVELEALREDVGSDRLRDVIDAVLEDLDAQEGSS